MSAKLDIPKTHISEWTAEEVGKVIGEEKHLSHYKTKFVEHKIDGKLLMQLSEMELEKDLKIESGIERKKIMNFINTRAKLDHHSCPLYPVVNPYNAPSGSDWLWAEYDYYNTKSMILRDLCTPWEEREEMLTSMKKPAAWYCCVCKYGASPDDVCYYCKKCKYGECKNCFDK